jgi:hydrogenase nickel incorporation protein HypA/HybF
MGELQQIDREIFGFALNEIQQARGGAVAGAEVDMEDEEAVMKCRVCGQEWSFDKALKKLSEGEKESIHFVPEIAHVYIACPSCGSPDFEFIKGRGVWLESIEGEAR